MRHGVTHAAPALWTGTEEQPEPDMILTLLMLAAQAEDPTPVEPSPTAQHFVDILGTPTIVASASDPFFTETGQTATDNTSDGSTSNDTSWDFVPYAVQSRTCPLTIGLAVGINEIGTADFVVVSAADGDLVVGYLPSGADTRQAVAEELIAAGVDRGLYPGGVPGILEVSAFVQTDDGYACASTDQQTLDALALQIAEGKLEELLMDY